MHHDLLLIRSDDQLEALREIEPTLSSAMLSGNSAASISRYLLRFAEGGLASLILLVG